MKNKEKNIWLITDTHFNHLKLEEWGDRSGDWQDRLWKSLKSIPAEDTLIHLGDVCIGGDGLIHSELSQLKCRKVLVRGNHDKKSLTFYQSYWDFVCDGLDLLYHGHYLHLTHRPQRERGNITHNIHGHTHGNMHRSEEYLDFYHPDYHIDICPELVGYEAVRLDILMKYR